MGDGTVIHLAGEPLRTKYAAVCRTDMATFLDGGTARVVPYPGGTRTADEVAAAAEAALATSGYCLWRNNCEHFATACKTGKARSRQILRAVLAGGALAGSACLTAAVVLASARGGRSAAGRS